jgi:Domain of unknown function (DUF4836)
MKKVFWFLFVLLVGSLVGLWWYVRKDNNMYRLVPKDAHLVMSLSIPALLNEISIDELKKLDIMDQFKGEFRELKDTVVLSRINALRDAGSNFGVDLFSDVVFFTTRYEGLDFKGLVFDIADPAEFRKLLNAIDPGYIIDMKANYSVMDLSEGTFLAWNKRGGIVVHNDYNYAYAKRTIRSNFIVETFSRSEEECIIGLPAFQANQDDNYLVRVFGNYQALDSAKVRLIDEGEVLVPPTSMFGGGLLKDSYFTGGIKHQNQTLILDGQVVSFVTGKVPFDQYTAKGLSEAHTKSIGSANPLALLGFAPRHGHDLDSLMAMPELNAAWSEWREKMGWSQEDAYSLFGSEFSFAFHGVSRVPFDSKTDVAPWDRSLLNMDEKGEMYVKQWTFSAHLVNNNAPLLQRTLDSLQVHNQLLENSGDDWIITMGNFKMYLVKTPLGLCLTNHKGKLEDFRNGQSGVMSDLLMNGLLNNQGFMYANLNPATFDEDTKDAITKLMGDESGNIVLRQFQDLSCEMKDGQFEMRLKLIEGEEKLLNRVIRIFNEVKNPAVS